MPAEANGPATPARRQAAGPGTRNVAGSAAADGPVARSAGAVQLGRAAVLLGFRRARGVARAADRAPGRVGELVLAAVRAAGGHRARVVVRLALGDRLQLRRNRAAGALALQPPAQAADRGPQAG